MGATAVGIGRLTVTGETGRGMAAAALDKRCYDRMMMLTAKLLRGMPAGTVACGGMPWADHVGIRLATDRIVPAGDLVIVMPAPFADGRYDEATEGGRAANARHDAFRRATGIDSLGEIDEAVDRGCVVRVEGTVRGRTAALAACDGLLAFTAAGGRQWSVGVGGPEVTASDARLGSGPVRSVWNASAASFKMHVDLG